MSEVLVNLADSSYVITIGAGVISRLGKAISERRTPTSVAVVTNPVVGRYYSDQVMESLRGAGLSARLITVPSGERFKTLGTVRRIYDGMLEFKMDRRGAVVALGGGVIGDMAGFAAATYMRGIEFYQVPTTLLSQVDASVGGKTGVDLPQGKNLVGAFHQPEAVLIDTLTLDTLPARELRSGLAEVIKHGIIYDLGFFSYLDSNAHRLRARAEEQLVEAIRRSVEIKRDVVQVDERESGLRAILNYGHTVGHAIEALSGYGKYRHGEALAVGMVTEAILAESAGIADEGVAAEIARTLEKFGLRTAIDPALRTEDLLRAVDLDKKNVGGRLRLALPLRIGECRIVDGLSHKDLGAAIGKHRRLQLQ